MKKIFTLCMGVLIALSVTGAELVSGTYYTSGGSFFVGTESGWQEMTSLIPSVEVTVNESEVSIVGLSYFAPTAAIKGTIKEDTITFANAQSLGTVQETAIYLVGSDDVETLSESIVFVWDGEAGTLSAETEYIAESVSATAVSPATYWKGAVFSAQEPEKPEAAVLPEGIELKEYAMSYTDYYEEAASGTAYIGFDEDTVYLVGFSTYFPNVPIVGLKEGTTITFPANQYLGTLQGLEGYFVTGATFTYDAATDTYTAEGDVYSLLGSKYIDVYATNPVLKGVVEKAAMPANPAITGLENSKYGYYVSFNVPNVDTNGDGLVASKLFYQFYVDVAGEVSALTFTTATHSKLTTDLTMIPYGFSENYDFYSDQIYLNGLYSAEWTKIGIQSIYYGGDVENKTEIQWYEIPSTEAIDNVEAAQKAVKRIENGQLVIEKNGRTYNAQGAVIK